MAASLGKGLVENRYDERADGDFQHAHQNHRKRGERERFPVRLDVSEESLKIAHRQFKSILRVNSRESHDKSLEEGFKRRLLN
jgi:hypothetical protein